MSQPTRPRKISTGTWAGLGAAARADLHASDSANPLLTAVLAILGTSIDLSAEAERALRSTLQSARRESFLAGTERETGLMIALDAERRLRLRYGRALIDAGLPLPVLSDGERGDPAT